MVKKSSKEITQDGKARLIIVNIIRILLALSFIWASMGSRKLIMIMSGLAIIVTFLPQLFEKYLKIKIPAKYEIIIILAIYGLLYSWDIRGVYDGIWLWGAILHFTTAILLGFVGLTVLYVLYKEKRLSSNPFIFAMFAFCFAVAIGSIGEIFEFGMDKLFGFKMQGIEIEETMSDLFLNTLGALTVAITGYFYVKKGKLYLLSSKLVEGFVVKNKRIFGTKESSEPAHEEVKKLAKKGESKHLEFKSSLRTNLHTKQNDKRMEHSVLKTVNAYLNSHGGTLLVGVDDKGEIIGTEHDQFPNKDSMNLHFTNMLKNQIGAEFLPFIRFDTVEVEGKNVMKIDCKKSHKESFLKTDKGEEFYVRNGPSSAQLNGRALIDYINNQFKK